MLMMTTRFPGSSKIYKRTSMTTRFVYSRETLLDVDEGNRRCNKQRSMIKAAS